jgi:four helix bundle protein
MADPLRDKAFAFAFRIVNVVKYLQEVKREFSLSKKLLDAGVNIGLFIEEARQGFDRADFILKYSLSNKEAFKSNYLLRLLRGGKYLSDEEAHSLLADCEELQRMLVSALKTSRQNQN